MNVINTSKAPAAIGPYIQGVELSNTGQMVITSGQLPVDPATGLMPENVALKNLAQERFFFAPKNSKLATALGSFEYEVHVSGKIHRRKISVRSRER